MNSNYSIHKVAFYVLSLCYISLFTSCTDEDVLDKQYGEMCVTMAFDANYVIPVVAGKVISGVASVALAYWLLRRKETK